MTGSIYKSSVEFEYFIHYPFYNQAQPTETKNFWFYKKNVLLHRKEADKYLFSRYWLIRNLPIHSSKLNFSNFSDLVIKFTVLNFKIFLCTIFCN